MATLLKVLNNLADIKSAGGVALHVRTQEGPNRCIDEGCARPLPKSRFAQSTAAGERWVPALGSNRSRRGHRSSYHRPAGHSYIHCMLSQPIPIHGTFAAQRWWRGRFDLGYYAKRRVTCMIRMIAPSCSALIARPLRSKHSAWGGFYSYVKMFKYRVQILRCLTTGLTTNPLSAAWTASLISSNS
jgi:hypothetical protein